MILRSNNMSLYFCKHLATKSLYVNCRYNAASLVCIVRRSKHNLTDLKGRSVAAQNWLIRQSKDPYVRRAREENYRCRSAFKLLELDDKHDFLHPGHTVIDLGAAPGSWSQVAVTRVNALHVDAQKPRGKVISVDIQHMLKVEGATILPLSDFIQPQVQQKILELLNQDQQSIQHVQEPGAIRSSSTESSVDIKQNIKQEVSINLQSTNQRRADVVLSDMAPPNSGIKSLDHQVIIRLAAAVVRFAMVGLVDGGTCVLKLWRGPEEARLVQAMQKCFEHVQVVKPPSSRSDSSEIFVLATQFHL